MLPSREKRADRGAKSGRLVEQVAERVGRLAGLGRGQGQVEVVLDASASA